MLDYFVRDCVCSANDTTSYATAFDEMRKAVSAYYVARGAELIMCDFQLAKALVALGLKLESTLASGTHREVPGFPGILEDQCGGRAPGLFGLSSAQWMAWCRVMLLSRGD